MSWRTFPGQGACKSCAASCADTLGASQPYSSENCSLKAREQRQDIFAALAQRRHRDLAEQPTGNKDQTAARPRHVRPALAGWKCQQCGFRQVCPGR